MSRLFLFLSFIPLAWPAAADEPALQRALIQRDQQSAEFAAGARRGVLEALHERQLLEAATAPQPGQRERMAREREALLSRQPAPSATAPVMSDPLPLPGGPAHGVQPVPAHRLGG
jgi:hypothetical protein